VRRTW